MAPRRSLVVGGSVGALVLAALLVAVLAARQPEVRYPANSPQGTVAAYLRLLQDGQVDKAYTLISPADMTPSMELGQFHQQFDGWSQRSHRVTMVRTLITGDQASVVVDISAFSGSAFGASDQTHRQTITLTRHGRGWLITGPSWLGYS